MISPNPYRRGARTFAFICCLFAGFILLIGVFFTIAAALADLSEIPALAHVSNAGIAVLVAAQFTVIAILVLGFAWLAYWLLGQDRLPEKLGAKTAAGCLRLGGMGCGLWGLLSAATTLILGKLITGEPAGPAEAFAGLSGFVIVVLLMLAVAWFISANFAKPQPGEETSAFQSYLNSARSLLPSLASPETRRTLQEQTLLVLPKLDASRKGALLGFLCESGLLSGFTRVALHGADFRRADLRAMSFPEADLRGINLEEANLQGASLFQAKLHQANLRGADFAGASLQGAVLRQADLTGAVLFKTNLDGADLTRAVVTRPQLAQARLRNTILPDGAIGS